MVLLLQGKIRLLLGKKVLGEVEMVLRQVEVEMVLRHVDMGLMQLLQVEMALELELELGLAPEPELRLELADTDLL